MIELLPRFTAARLFQVPGRHFVEVSCMPKLRDVLNALKDPPVMVVTLFALVMIGAVAIGLMI